MKNDVKNECDLITFGFICVYIHTENHRVNIRKCLVFRVYIYYNK